MVEFLLGCVGSVFFWFVAWIVLLPLWMIIATPYVLVIAALDSSSYGLAVRDRYATAMDRHDWSPCSHG